MTGPLLAGAWPLLIVAAVAAGGLGYLGGYVIGLKCGHERGKHDASIRYMRHIERLEREREKFRIWRAQSRPPWAIEAPAAPVRPALPSRVPALVATAADIAPVTVPEPAPGDARQAEPGTFASLTDTGAMRAITEITDEFIAEIQAGKTP
jgi:hypothetical protein